jgi:hypothetical protein
MISKPPPTHQGLATRLTNAKRSLCLCAQTILVFAMLEVQEEPKKHVTYKKPHQVSSSYPGLTGDCLVQPSFKNTAILARARELSVELALFATLA